MIIFVAAILLVISAVSIFLVTFDVNEYKGELSNIVRLKTGRELEFKGDIGLTMYPSLGMKLGSMSFSNASGFGNEPMLAVNNVSVSVDLLSLLSFEPKIAELTLDGLDVNLQKNKQGVTNWDDLIPQTETSGTGSSPDDEVVVRVKTDKGIDINAAFEGLAVTNVKLLWSDAVAGSTYKVNIDSLLTGRIAEGQDFPVQLAMSLQSVNELTADVSVNADVNFTERKILVKNLRLDGTARGEKLPVDELLMMVSGDISVNQLNKKVSISGFNTKIQTSGGVLQKTTSTLAGEIGFDQNQQQLTIAVLDIQSDLEGADLPDQHISAAVSASRLDVFLNKRSVSLQDLILGLNENSFKGFVKVLDYAQPDIQFELESDKLDVDKLLGQKVEPVAPVEQKETAKDVEIALPMEFLRALKLDGKVSISTLVAQGLTLKNAILKMDAKNGIVSVDPLKMDLYDGNFEGMVNINVQGKRPVYHVKKKLSSFHVGEFLKDFMGKDPVSGKASMDVDVKTGGNWLSHLKANLNGQVSIDIKDGALKGFNLRHSIESAKARLKLAEQPEFKEKQTDFSALSISGQIKDGVLTTDDLNMQAPLLRVAGKGSIDIVSETMDYLVDAKLVTTTKGQDGGQAENLSGIPIPVVIRGPWLSPEIDVQYDEMLKSRLAAEKAQAREAIAKQKQQLTKRLAAEKEKLKASKQKELAASKLQLQKKRELEAAEQKAKLAAEKQKKQAELDASKKAAKDKAKKKLEDKLKKLF